MSQRAVRGGRWAGRSIGVILIGTGLGKALDVPGFVDVIATYRLLPAWGNVLVGYALPPLELAIGLALVSGVVLRSACAAAAGLHALLLVVSVLTLGRGIAIENCGCFGAFWARPLGPSILVEDGVLLAASLWALWASWVSWSTGALPRKRRLAALRWTALALLVASGSGCSTVSPAGIEPRSSMEDPFSHGDLTRFLERFVDGHGRVDYAAASSDRASLQRYIAATAATSPDATPALFPTERDRLAYWINAYNAWVLHIVLDRHPVAGVGDFGPPRWVFFLPRRSGFFLFQRITLGERRTSLYYLEHGVIRRRFSDPRVHFALNCASRSCPRLPRRAFEPATLDDELERETRRFIGEPGNVAIDPAAGTIRLSSIFDWYEADFVGWMKAHRPQEPASVLGYVAVYLPEAERDRLVSCAGCRVVYSAYDWGLNDRSASRSPGSR